MIMTKAFAGMGIGIRLGLVAVAVSLMGNLPVMAIDQFWSGNATSAGGAGTWDTTNPHFALATGGPYTTVWNNATNAGDTAIFDGTAASVTVGTVTVNSLTFSPNPVAAYTLTGGTITFSGANPTITVNTGGTTNTTLTSNYTGTSQITKMGIGRLELNNASNTNAGGYNIVQGFINLAAANRLGTGAALPGTLDADWFVFAGGGLTSSNAAAQDLGNTRGVTLNGKAWLGASATTNPVTISAPITGTGDIIVANATTTAVNGGSASPLNTTFNAGGVWILGNNANNWTGDAQIGSGTLREGTSNVIPDASVVYLSNSGVQFDLGTNNTTDTVRGISGTAGTVAVGTAGSLTVSVPMSESYTYGSVLTATAAGTGKVTKDGAGTWILSGGSTGFNGEFVMNAGTLGVGGSNIFGNASNTSKVTYLGGTLSNNGTGGRTIPAPIPLAINANMTVDDSLFNTSAPGQILFNGPATMNADRTITVNGLANLGLADLRETGGTRNLVKEGGGTLAMTGTVAANANEFTGTVTVNAGRLQVGGATYVGNETNTIILNGGNLSTSASRTVQLANPISVTSNSSAITTSSIASTPNFDFSNNNPFTFSSGSIVLTLRNDGGDASTDQLRIRLFGSGFNIANNIDMPNGTASSTVELSSFNTTGTTQTFSGVISGTGDFKRSASTGGTGGTTIMAAQNTFSGGVQLNDGTIEFGVDSVGPANAPTSGPVGTGTITIGNINAPKLAANGGARNVGNPIAFSASNNVMGITGSNALTLTGDVNLGTGARVLNVDNSALSTMSGAISGTGGSLTKDLGGVLKITGNNSYDTGTTVTAGTLLVSNTSGSGTGSGPVTVAAAGTLGGTGTIGNTITNNGIIAPGESGAGTLNVTGDVVDAIGSSWTISLSGASATKLAVTGGVDLSASDSLNVTGIGSGSSWLIGTYSGTLNGVFDGITSGYTVNYSGGNITLNATVACAPGDLNCDGHEDARDYVFWRKNNSTPPGDYAIWRANFGNPPGAGSGGGLGGGTVPEPSAIVLLVMGLLAVGVRRRR
jgi:fibronectin-binding autotransporter adhesin